MITEHNPNDSISNSNRGRKIVGYQGRIAWYEFWLHDLGHCRSWEHVLTPLRSVSCKEHDSKPQSLLFLAVVMDEKKSINFPVHNGCVKKITYAYICIDL